jgi:hypothetical protein
VRGAWAPVCAIVAVPWALGVKVLPHDSERYAQAAWSGVKVTVGKRIVLRKDEGTNWFPNIYRMANGNLIAACQTAPDETNPGATEVGRRFLSTDNGNTWRELGTIDVGGPSAVTLRDGTFLQLWFYTQREGEGWVTKVVRSTDNGRTYTVEDNVPVYVDSVQEGDKQTGMYFDGGLVEMDNGDLLATMYGYFVGDTKFRCILVKSTDKGHSWRFVSTIAYDPNAPNEGYCEPAMIRTGPQSLLVTMRTGMSPMYQCRSTNAGKTWSKPTIAADRGVEPDLVMTDDGILVCSYGRPDVWVMCSPDGHGRQWTANTLLYQGASTCYTGMAKIGPNEILLIHDALGHKEPGDEKPYNYVFIVPLIVEREP